MHMGFVCVDRERVDINYTYMGKICPTCPTVEMEKQRYFLIDSRPEAGIVRQHQTAVPCFNIW